MLIQEVGPLPVDPLATLDEDYREAVLHLAWDRHAETGVRTLLFAWVELLPAEVPPPLDDGEQRRRLGERSQHTVHVRRLVVPARRALGWYLECRRGISTLPDDEGRLPEAADGATKIILAELGEEPPWPTLVCVSGESDTVPFCPAWHRHPRVHHLVPLAGLALEKIWTEEAERAEATRWLSERMHFRIEDYPEYWGSVHLVAPNPVYRKVDERLQMDPQQREAVLVRFYPRAGQSVEGLELRYVEKEPWGPRDVRHVAVNKPLVRLDFDRTIGRTTFELTDRRRGTLEVQYLESMFVRSIRIAEQKAMPTEQPPEIPKAATARAHLHESMIARERRSHSRQLVQRWFSGQQGEVVDVLRSIGRLARREMLLVDPTLGPGELSLAVSAASRWVPLHILTSASVLRRVYTHAEHVTDPGEMLLSELQRLTSEGLPTTLQIRVMASHAPIHDQFLLADHQVWLLGVPLRDLGARGTMLTRLPDPDLVREQLFKSWNEATDLQRWVNEGRAGLHAATEGAR